MNVLFLCSKNQWRSPTAERVFRDVDGLSVRSAGTNQSARRVVSLRDVAWAEVIFVMEQKHLDRLREAFRDEIGKKVVHVLELADDYRFMDDELVRILRSAWGRSSTRCGAFGGDRAAPGPRIAGARLRARGHGAARGRRG